MLNNVKQYIEYNKIDYTNIDHLIGDKLKTDFLHG